MNQRRVILGVIAIGLVTAALWYGRGSSDQADVTMTPTKGTTSLQDAFHGPSSAPAPQESPPASGSVISVGSAPASEVAPPSTSAPAEPPQSVDTPEPAQKKFARGGKPDESEQN